jgi:Domain of unknown function (DUF4157)
MTDIDAWVRLQATMPATRRESAKTARRAQGTGTSRAASTLFRAPCADCPACRNELLRMQMSAGNQYVNRMLSRSSSEGASDEVERSIESARGGGHALDHSVRAKMEPAFGADFGGVRIHTDARADGLSTALSARAFATGNDIFFRQGQYDPGSSNGRELLAHELTHVVQQTGGGVQRAMTVSQPDDPHEVEAENMARAVMRAEHEPGSGGVGGIDRQAEAPLEEDKKKDEHALPGVAAVGRVVSRRVPGK